MGNIEHRTEYWLAFRYPGEHPVVITSAAEALVYEGYRVDGPFVHASQLEGAVDALREIHDARDEHALGLRAMAGRALRTMGVDPPTTRGPVELKAPGRSRYGVGGEADE